MKRPRSSLSTILTIVVAPAVVSLAVTLLLLNLWDKQKEPETVVLPFSSTAMIPPRDGTEGASDEIGGDAQAGAEAGAEAGGEGSAEGGPCENPVHTVAAGETLGAIAEQYGLTLDDVILMNQMADPAFNENFLSIGQTIIIPACGVPTPTPSPTPTETPVPTRVVPTPGPTATELSGGQVSVGIARVLSPGDAASEAVEVLNKGTSVARLGGWQLVNVRTEQSFTFPPLNLFPQGAVTVYTGSGENTAIDIYWGQNSAVWEPGDTLQLLNDDGDVQDEFQIPEE